MAGRSVGADVLHQLDTLFRVGVVGDLSDGQLVQRFLDARDGADQAAFAALVERHGPMVLRVCRQVLGDSHDVQDAFQATFLVLVRKAGSVRKADSVASWLYGVAHRVAVRAKADAARRRAHERRGAVMAAESLGGAGQAESCSVLHEEIARLPERYREPVVLCYLEGLTTEAAAQRLGWPRGTVLSRLSRARERLRGRLTRRGLAPSAGLLVAWLSPGASTAGMPAALLEATVRACLKFAGRQVIATALASATAVALARGVIYTMTISKLKILGASALACVFALGGVQTFAFQFGGIGGGGTPKPTGAVSDADDRRIGLVRSVDELQARLDDANRRNAVLQKDLQDIRAKLDALGANQPAAGKEAKEEDLPHLQRQDKKVRSLRLSESKASPLEVNPIVGPGIVGLDLKGPKITRIAASGANGVWRTQELRESVEGHASPIVVPGVVSYCLGRYVYAFSSKASRWDVVELPEGVQADSLLDPSNMTIRDGDHMYKFSVETGKWEHIDFRALLDSSEDAEKRDTEPKK